MSGWIVATAVGCAAVGGIFFAFSSFVMGALARLTPAEGIRAMQAINVVVLNRSFFALFFGSGAAAVGLFVWGIAGGATARPALLGAAALLYGIGTLGVTIACNVPRNEALARLDPEDADAVGTWDRYLREWTAWNHVRTAAALAAAAVLITALPPA